MSTDRKRLTSAIQRIAREDPEIRALLDDFRNSGGKPSETASSGAGAEDRQICCNGSSSGSANPGSGIKDPSAGGQDASGGLGDDPARLESGPGSLTGVKDCTTGEPICFEGADWIPPDGWDAASDPPVDPNWEEGIFWRVVWQQTPDGGTQSSGTDYYAARPNICGYSICDGISCDSSTGSIFGACAAGNYSAQRQRESCSEFADDPEAQAVCLDEPPLLDAWPEDGCVNLAVKGGKLVGSKYDPENDGSYSKPRSEIQLCDDFGNQISIRPAGTGVLPTGAQTSVPERITGGWKTFNTINDNGYLYDSSGKQIAHIDGNEYSDPNV